MGNRQHERFLNAGDSLGRRHRMQMAIPTGPEGKCRPLIAFIQDKNGVWRKPGNTSKRPVIIPCGNCHDHAAVTRCNAGVEGRYVVDTVRRRRRDRSSVPARIRAEEARPGIRCDTWSAAPIRSPPGSPGTKRDLDRGVSMHWDIAHRPTTCQANWTQREYGQPYYGLSKGSPFACARRLEGKNGIATAFRCKHWTWLTTKGLKWQRPGLG